MSTWMSWSPRKARWREADPINNEDGAVMPMDGKKGDPGFGKRAVVRLQPHSDKEQSSAGPSSSSSEQSSSASSAQSSVQSSRA